MTTILVAEDDKDIRELIEVVLGYYGFDVIAVSDGQAAIMAAVDNSFGLILLDVRMPKMDGYQVCRQLRSMPECEETPIVMLSALGQESEIAQGMAAGADEYILKPFTPATLIGKVRQYVVKNQ